MGLIRAAVGAAGGVLADQWKEYFVCDALSADTIAVRGQKRMSGRSSNFGSDNVISNGSGIVVAEGQCAIVVDSGVVKEVVAEPGQFTYDQSKESSIFDGGKFGENLKNIIANMGERFTYGGEAPRDQRVYYFNTKEMIGNKYGTANPVPFRTVDERAGIDIDISVKCFGEYSYKITNPVLFYGNVCGNISNEYKRSSLDDQLKSELLTQLQPAFAELSKEGVRYSQLPAFAPKLALILNELLSAQWKDLRGIEIVSFGVSSVSASEDDERMIKELQRNAAFTNPQMAAAYMVGQTGQAMTSAASNPNGAAAAFMGMNMAQGVGGINVQGLYNMGAQQAPQGDPMMQGQAPAAPAAPATPAAPVEGQWFCQDCGTRNTGNFCSNCGKPKR